MKLLAFVETFNRDDVTFARRRERRTGQDTLAFDDHGASAARTLIASLFSASETEFVSENVEQSQARVQRKFVCLVVNTKSCAHAYLPVHLFP